MADMVTENGNEKVVWAENISYLAKESGIKLMELAEEAGVAVSFFSRARKGDSRADAKVLSKMALKLGVSLDTLMNCDLTAMTPNERLVLNFLDKVIIDANTSKLEWVKETRKEMEQLNEEGEPVSPLFKAVEKDGQFQLEYKSLFKKDKLQIMHVWQNGYHTALSKDAWLYVISVGIREVKEEGGLPNFYTGLEIYILDMFGYNPVCCSFNGTNGEIVQRVKDLYNIARLKCDRIVLNSDTVEIMSAYIQGTLDERNFLPY